MPASRAMHAAELPLAENPLQRGACVGGVVRLRSGIAFHLIGEIAHPTRGFRGFGRKFRRVLLHLGIAEKGAQRFRGDRIMTFRRADFPSRRQPPADKSKLFGRYVLLSDRVIEAVKFGSARRCLMKDIAGARRGQHGILLRGSRLPAPNWGKKQKKEKK